MIMIELEMCIRDSYFAGAHTAVFFEQFYFHSLFSSWPVAVKRSFLLLYRGFPPQSTGTGMEFPR